MSESATPRTRSVEIWRLEGSALRDDDCLAVEEPLEIRLRAGEETSPLAITMRTPGEDHELALGFLVTEGLIRTSDDVVEVRRLPDPWGEADAPSNVLEVELACASLPDLARLERHFFASSACGVCGRAGIANLRLRGLPLPSPEFRVRADTLLALPASLKAAQGVFQITGGLHAAAAFSSGGELLALREDVGRHNALDKLVGWALTEARLPLSSSIILVSGRASFEILQKCAVVGVPLVASVSAPSSLAVEVAREVGTTLVGFLRESRFNLYHGEERVLG